MNERMDAHGKYVFGSGGELSHGSSVAKICAGRVFFIAWLPDFFFLSISLVW
jgi:hypothetical protein